MRFHLYAGSDAIRVVHSVHDRHVRFAGEGDGVLAEAVRGITGLRHD